MTPQTRPVPSPSWSRLPSDLREALDKWGAAEFAVGAAAAGMLRVRSLTGQPSNAILARARERCADAQEGVARAYFARHAPSPLPLNPPPVLPAVPQSPGTPLNGGPTHGAA